MKKTVRQIRKTRKFLESLDRKVLENYINNPTYTPEVDLLDTDLSLAQIDFYEQNGIEAEDEATEQYRTLSQISVDEINLFLMRVPLKNMEQYAGKELNPSHYDEAINEILNR